MTILMAFRIMLILVQGVTVNIARGGNTADRFMSRHINGGQLVSSGSNMLSVKVRWGDNPEGV